MTPPEERCGSQGTAARHYLTTGTIFHVKGCGAVQQKSLAGPAQNPTLQFAMEFGVYSAGQEIATLQLVTVHADYGNDDDAAKITRPARPWAN
jgi:hypothetical protein